jgi:hypothetical protein
LTLLLNKPRNVIVLKSSGKINAYTTIEIFTNWLKLYFYNLLWI